MTPVKSAKLVNHSVPAVFWKRFLAYFFDVFLVNLLVLLPFMGYLQKFTNNPLELLTTQDKSLMILGFFISLSVFLYFIILEYTLKQTLGKMLFKLHIVSLKGKTLTFKQVILSNLTVPFSFVLLIDVCYMFFKGGHQRLFEVFSGVAVVEKELTVQ